MQEWLKAHPLTGTKKAWVASRVNKFVSDIDEKANNEEIRKRETGASISRATKLKMRLFEACFLDEHRDTLIRMYDSKNRQELDARNSDRRPKTFFEYVTEKYNDEDWNPTSTVFEEFHHELSNSFLLPLF